MTSMTSTLSTTFSSERGRGRPAPCVPDVLAEFALDVWLLARVGRDSSGALVDGRVWERAVGSLLRRHGLRLRQGPGTTTLFGFHPASGIGHEIDGAAAGRDGSVILECKSQSCGVTKEDAALFHEKTLDFYCGHPRVIGRERWWRLLISSSPVSDAVRAFCIQLGLILCDPVRVPLPVVVRTAGRPNADLCLRETLLQEVLRMGEPALTPMQDRWAYDPDTHDIRFKPQVLKADEIGDLLWLQDELGADILDLYDLYRPGVLERRGSLLYSELRKSA